MIYNELLNSCPESVVEVGGILGCENGIITAFVSDEGQREYGKYVPNVHFLNNMIMLWNAENIDFAGIYHSHFPNGKALSNGDIHYIETIMTQLCDVCSILYFPIVIPKKEIVSYRAEIVCEKVLISIDKIIITN